ncbi:putative Ig domain-containing protein [Agarivorans sp. 1_MG-2023]|uniref:putative Ig domain-containing protein n=1 Tax=Agarivorans sp. 1_MG-2023 TaxID=3062634 RepID=UPI0026E421C8|nr:putative Ig domain-containing protein [Agarivorans sp. 1_MG-2023]MDO6764299.1 putative Ig domain-containing protein [Agarivorans sp. 1_MG-2023]
MKYAKSKLASLIAISLSLTACGGGGGDSSPKNVAPTISGTPQSSIDEGVAFNFTPVASDENNDTLSFSITNKPTWASFDEETGVLSGTPAREDIGSVSDIIISVSDGKETASLAPFELSVSRVLALSGKVIDGYVSGAVVFLDLNLNGELDENEPSAISDNTGAYTLALKGADITSLKSAPIRALLGDGAIDLDTGEDFSTNPVVLSAPPLFELDENEDPTGAAISPFTSLVVDELKESLTLLASGSVSAEQINQELMAAKTKVVADLGLDGGVEVILGDFLSDEVGEAIKAALAKEAIDRTTERQEAAKKEQELKQDLEDNQTVEVTTRRSSRKNWIAGKEDYFLVEQSKITTLLDDGTKKVAAESVSYLTYANYKRKLDGDQEALIFEKESWTENYLADGTYSAHFYWETDLNQDNLRTFKGRVYRVGTHDEAGQLSYVAYHDESSSIDEGGYDDDESFDDIDIEAAVNAGNLSQIEWVQRVTHSSETLESGEQVKTRISESLDKEELEPYFRRTQVTTTFADGSVSNEELRDSSADGTINDYTKETLTPNGEREFTKRGSVYTCCINGVFEEYAQYRWDRGELTNYWEDYQESSKVVDGLKVSEGSGGRYVYSYDTGMAELGQDGKAIKFQDWKYTTTDLSETLSLEFNEYHHYGLDNYSFTKEEPGQAVKVWEKGDSGLWLGHDYPEWNSAEIEGLDSKIKAALDSGLSYAEIDESVVAGLSAYNVLRFSDSFVYQANGDVRTWFLVNQFEGEWQLQETGLEQLPNGWRFNVVPGGMVVKLEDSDDYYSRDNYTPVPLIDADVDKGYFESQMYWDPEQTFYGYLNQAAAQAKLDALIAEEAAREAAMPRERVSVLFTLPSEQTTGLNQSELEALYTSYSLRAENAGYCQSLTKDYSDRNAAGETIAFSSVDALGAVFNVDIYTEVGYGCFEFDVVNKDGSVFAQSPLRFERSKYALAETKIDSIEVDYAGLNVNHASCDLEPLDDLGPLQQQLFLRSTGNPSSVDGTLFEYVGNNTYQAKVFTDAEQVFNFELTSEDESLRFYSDNPLYWYGDQVDLVPNTEWDYSNSILLSSQKVSLIAFEINDSLDVGSILVAICEDGTLSNVETTTGPMLMSDTEKFEEYSHYVWNAPYMLTDYWFENTEAKKVVNAEVVTELTGKRLVINASKDDAQPDLDGEVIEFQNWQATQTQISDTLSINYGKYQHIPLDEYAFTANDENIGQSVRVWEKGATGIWLGHEYPEWGSVDVVDLTGQVRTAIDAGKTYAEIDSSVIPNLGDYNRLALNESLIFDDEGNPRTWYLVNQFDAAGWEVTTTTLELLPNGWVFKPIPGGLIIVKSSGNTPVPVLAADVDAGSFESQAVWGDTDTTFFGYLDLASANAKLLELSPP